ncbi:MAG: class I SAM-dependent methyltransferase, partial [bacterium]
MDERTIPDLMFAFIKSGLLKTAVDLELFTHIARGARSAAAVASAAGADRRAVGIVLDALSAIGVVRKDADGYGLDPMAEMLLVKDSPAYVAGFTRVTLSPQLWQGVGKLTETVRSGHPPESMVDVPDHPFWETFSEASERISDFGASAVADQLGLAADAPAQILDVAAGSGVYGFSALQRLPNAHLTSLDWANVLEHARKHAAARGVAERVTWLPGSAFDAPLPQAHFDAVICSHFFHHFDAVTNQRLTRRLFDAVKPGGRLLIHDFVPDDARAAHEGALMFAVVMLATTEHGNSYTFGEYCDWLEAAGFRVLALQPVPMGASSVVVAQRPA